MDESPGNEVEQFYSLTVSHSLSEGKIDGCETH